MRKIKFLVFALSLLLIGNILCAAENVKTKNKISQEKAVKNFIAWDKNLKTLDTFYTQEVFFEDTSISKSFGRVFKNGQNLRLETLENGKITQYALTDKKIIQIFDEKGLPVMDMTWQNWQESQQNKSLFDFGNYEKILQEHNITSFEISEDGYILALTPKKGPVYTLTFVLGKNFFPKEISLYNDGVKSKTILENTKINKNLEEKLFK